MARPRRQPFSPLLADYRRAGGFTQEQVAERVGISAEMVRKHERGISMPSEIYRTRYCELYRATEEQLGLRPGHNPIEPPPNTQDRNFAEPASSSAMPPQLWTPDYGDSEYLEAAAQQIQHIVSLDNKFGGADLTRLAARFFRSLHDRLGTGAYDPRIERDLLAVAGELAEVTGWLAYDADQQDLVRRMNQEALYFTRLAGDRQIELLTLQNASMHAGFLGRPREALQIANSVLEGEAKLSPRLRSLFLTRKARALAQGGDESALKVFGQIRSLYLDGTRDYDPAWAWWVDERELDWHEAMARQDLGMPGEAVTLFERSVAGIPPNETRSQYVHRAHLLESQVAVGTWLEATQTMQQLQALAPEVASTRTVVLLSRILDRIGMDTTPAEFQDEARALRRALADAPV